MQSLSNMSGAAMPALPQVPSLLQSPFSASSCHRLIKRTPCPRRLFPARRHRAWRAMAADSEPSKTEEPPPSSSPPSSFGGLTTEELELKIGKRSGRARKDRPKPASAAPSKPPPKDWDAMTLAEKAWELYIGEKGVLFWINKLAYAAIFVTVGGWIVFRFIGPALGWYKLESPLLPPDELLGGPN